MVDLLKRNHDVMMEKYELYRQRNETLEKAALDREQLHSKMKSECDNLADQVHSLKRRNEDLKQENSILSQRVTTAEEASKTNGEQAHALKTSKDKFEGQLRAMQEQLSMVQRSHDELASKKQTETDLMGRELNMVKLRERDAKAKILQLEKDISCLSDDLRSTRGELDVRTRENDHIVSLLEDQEQKISLYEEKEKQI